MHKLFVAVPLVSLIAATAVLAGPRPGADPKDQPAALLKLGDPAPALKASKWLQGDAVKSFEPGKIYVVEFWATWCGPCLTMMPHLADLQEQYKAKGVTFIGFTTWDPDNTEEQVAAFVRRRGPKLKYTFAYGEDTTAYDAWVKAAGRDGYPWAFVVDKTGHIAYIGHPMFLGIVVPKVLAGDATPKAIADEVSKAEQELQVVLDSVNGPYPKAALKTVKDFETKYPPMADNPYLAVAKLFCLPQAGRIDDAKKLAETVIAKATERGDPIALSKVYGIFLSGPGKRDKDLDAVAVKAAEAMVQAIGDKDAMALLTLASVYSETGNKARAKEYARKAAEAAAGEPNPKKRAYIERQAEKFTDDKK